MHNRDGLTRQGDGSLGLRVALGGASALALSLLWAVGIEPRLLDESHEVARVPGLPRQWEPDGTRTPAGGRTGTVEPERTPTAEAAAGAARSTTTTAPGGEAGSTPAASPDGLQVYRSACAPCHGVAGQGSGDFPRLDGNQVVTGDPELVIQIILSGQRRMPSWRDQRN